MTKEQRLNWQKMYGVCFDELGCKSQAELPQERFMLWLIDKVQLLHKHDVIRWQAFSSEQPIYGTDVIVYNPQTKHEMIIRWSRAVENLVDKGYKCWYEKPAIV